MKLTNTKELAQNQGVNILAYGLAGAGKTFSISTYDGKPLILSAEGGLLSLSQFDIDVIEVKSIDDMRKVYKHIATGDAPYDLLAIDSLSELAESLLHHELQAARDPRQAYGEVLTQITNLVREFRNLPIHCYFTCKMERTKDEFSGGLVCYPGLPGQKLGQTLPYLVDEVFCLRVEKNKEGETVRMFQTTSDEKYYAKDRSGKLGRFEPPNLTEIINKLKG